MHDVIAVLRKGTCVLALLALSASGLDGCAKAKGTTAAEKRNYTLDMREDTLKKLYQEKPEARDKVLKASGYGVFSNVGMNFFVLASGNGFGVVHDNGTQREVYMKMREIGLGIGIGGKEFYAVILLNSPEALKAFVSEGWEWGADADAASKTGEGKGGAATATGNLQKDMEVYLMTGAGFALQATASGTKYWPDEELNEGGSKAKN